MTLHAMHKRAAATAMAAMLLVGASCLVGASRLYSRPFGVSYVAAERFGYYSIPTNVNQAMLDREDFDQYLQYAAIIEEAPRVQEAISQLSYLSYIRVTPQVEDTLREELREGMQRFIARLRENPLENYGGLSATSFADIIENYALPCLIDGTPECESLTHYNHSEYFMRGMLSMAGRGDNGAIDPSGEFLTLLGRSWSYFYTKSVGTSLSEIASNATGYRQKEEDRLLGYAIEVLLGGTAKYALSPASLTEEEVRGLALLRDYTAIRLVHSANSVRYPPEIKQLFSTNFEAYRSYRLDEIDRLVMLVPLPRELCQAMRKAAGEGGRYCPSPVR